MALPKKMTPLWDGVFLRQVPAGRMLCEHELVRGLLGEFLPHYPDAGRLLPLCRNIALLSLALCDEQGQELYTPQQVAALLPMEQIASLAALYRQQEEGEHA